MAKIDVVASFWFHNFERFEIEFEIQINSRVSVERCIYNILHSVQSELQDSGAHVLD